MKLVISKRALLQVQRILLLCGISALGYCLFVVADSWFFQQAESNQLDRLISEALQDTPPKAVLTKGAIGRLDIERLGVSVIVVEGTSAKALRHAAGHITGTALPGDAGNIGVSAHRDTFFRPLRNIKANDLITITTPAERYQYQVVSTQIVDPSNVAVLNATKHEVLTLVTCYPFYFIGTAPSRFIVRAERISPGSPEQIL